MTGRHDCAVIIHVDLICKLILSGSKCKCKCNVQIYIARLQKFSDALTAENKNVFSFAAKVQTVQFNIRSSGGRLFHTRGPATAKFLAPMARGTYRVLVSADRSGRRPATDDRRTQSSVR